MEITNQELLLLIGVLHVEKALLIGERDALLVRLAELEEPEPKLEAVVNEA